MTSTMFTSGGTGESIRFAVGKCSLGSILVAATEQGVCAILLGDDADALLHDLQGRFPMAQLIGGDPRLRGRGGQGRRFCRGTVAGSRSAARCAGVDFRAARLASAAGNPGRLDGELCGDRRTYRRTERSVRCWASLCIECYRRRHSLPSGRSQEWRARRLPLGRSAQARASRTRGTVMNAAAKTVTSIAPSKSVSERVEKLDWERVWQELDAQGSVMIGRLLSPDESQSLAALYPKDDIFRSRVVMARHGFGRGEYKYFRYPLPDLIAGLRTAIYPHLVPIANRWNEAMGIDVRYPEEHADFIERCRQAGQDRPTPLLLQYGADDYNCLHQDLYGEHVFPLQLTILLSRPDKDFTGGEFVMTEQRPRMQSRPLVVPLRQGDGVVFAVHNRPVQGTRGMYRVNLRHGVSRVRSGHRHTVGIIFHDAQ